MVKQLPLVFRKKKSKEIMEMDNTTVSVRKVFDKEEFKEMVRDRRKNVVSQNYRRGRVSSRFFRESAMQ